MAPRTRRSQTKGTAVGTPSTENERFIPLEGSTAANINMSTQSKVPARRVVPGSALHHQPALGKRTLTQFQSNNKAKVSSASSIQANPTKKQRTVGPNRTRPMSLVLPSENEATPINENTMGNHGPSDGSGINGKGKRLERTSSFYPGRGDNSHELASLAHDENTGSHLPEVDDEGAETDEDPADEEQTLELALRFPDKFSESLAIERPSWPSSGGSAPGNSAGQSSSVLFGDAGLSTVTGQVLATGQVSNTFAQPGHVTSVDLTQLSALATELLGGNAPAMGQPAWPVHTELILSSDSDRLKLTQQRDLVRSVLQKAIEHLRAAMLFTNAFPDVSVALGFIKDCLLNAADQLRPGSAHIIKRLEEDQEYLSKISSVPRARICLIRREAKDYCVTITAGTFLMFGSPADIINYVSRQLSNYTYTFPRANSTSGPNGLVMRTRPYRNDRIINAIRGLYFSGGAKSFAKQFQYLFPIYETYKGEVREVPIHMVALVATALYAAIYEWSTGEQQIQEFSANAYLDVYNGHVNTLKHIREHREGAFHLMMADIYVQANTSAAAEANTVVPIANLDLDDIDG